MPEFHYKTKTFRISENVKIALDRARHKAKLSWNKLFQELLQAWEEKENNKK